MSPLSTIQKNAEGIFKEQASVFYSFIISIQTEVEIKDIIKTYRKKYYDATHVCYAYRLGVDQIIEKASDAGEPAHTAGTPILNQIKSAGLSNVLLIVVRYYGGHKLGKSGLIEAYKNAALSAISSATIMDLVETERYQFLCKENVIGEFMKIAQQEKVLILSTDYNEQWLITFQLDKNQCTRFLSKIKLLGEWVA